MSKRKVVAVSGGFDPIHIGHVRLLRAANRLGRLVVILNNDAFLRRKKGYTFMPLPERKEILESIKGVRRVVISTDEDDSVCETLKTLKPDIFANGGDRRKQGDLRETKVCEHLGIKMVFGVGGDKVRSSSALVKKLGG